MHSIHKKDKHAKDNSSKTGLQGPIKANGHSVVPAQAGRPASTQAMNHGVEASSASIRSQITCPFCELLVQLLSTHVHHRKLHLDAVGCQLLGVLGPAGSAQSGCVVRRSRRERSASLAQSQDVGGMGTVDRCLPARPIVFYTQTLHVPSFGVSCLEVPLSSGLGLPARRPRYEGSG